MRKYWLVKTTGILFTLQFLVDVFSMVDEKRNLELATYLLFLLFMVSVIYVIVVNYKLIKNIK